MYIMFPIAWMYYFGTNLDTRFTVPDFWPEPESTHKIPFEKEDQLDMVKKLKDARLEKRRQRLEREQQEGVKIESLGEGRQLEGVAIGAKRREGSSPVFGVGSIDRWAQGR